MWTCPCGGDFAPSLTSMACSCSHAHQHLQLSCPACGFIRVVHTDDLAATVEAWNADHPDDQLPV